MALVASAQIAKYGKITDSSVKGAAEAQAREDAKSAYESSTGTKINTTSQYNEAQAAYQASRGGSPDAQKVATTQQARAPLTPAQVAEYQRVSAQKSGGYSPLEQDAAGNYYYPRGSTLEANQAKEAQAISQGYKLTKNEGVYVAPQQEELVYKSNIGYLEADSLVSVQQNQYTAYQDKSGGVFLPVEYFANAQETPLSASQKGELGFVEMGKASGPMNVTILAPQGTPEYETARKIVTATPAGWGIQPTSGGSYLLGPQVQTTKPQAVTNPAAALAGPAASSTSIVGAKEGEVYAPIESFFGEEKTIYPNLPGPAGKIGVNILVRNNSQAVDFGKGPSGEVSAFEIRAPDVENMFVISNGKEVPYTSIIAPSKLSTTTAWSPNGSTVNTDKEYDLSYAFKPTPPGQPLSKEDIAKYDYNISGKRYGEGRNISVFQYEYEKAYGFLTQGGMDNPINYYSSVGETVYSEMKMRSAAANLPFYSPSQGKILRTSQGNVEGLMVEAVGGFAGAGLRTIYETPKFAAQAVSVGYGVLGTAYQDYQMYGSSGGIGLAGATSSPLVTRNVVEGVGKPIVEAAPLIAIGAVGYGVMVGSNLLRGDVLTTARQTVLPSAEFAGAVTVPALLYGSAGRLVSNLPQRYAGFTNTIQGIEYGLTYRNAPAQFTGAVLTVPKSMTVSWYEQSSLQNPDELTKLGSYTVKTGERYDTSISQMMKGKFSNFDTGGRTYPVFLGENQYGQYQTAYMKSGETLTQFSGEPTMGDAFKYAGPKYEVLPSGQMRATQEYLFTKSGFTDITGAGTVEASELTYIGGRGGFLGNRVPAKWEIENELNLVRSFGKEATQQQLRTYTYSSLGTPGYGVSYSNVVYNQMGSGKFSMFGQTITETGGAIQSSGVVTEISGPFTSGYRGPVLQESGIMSFKSGGATNFVDIDVASGSTIITQVGKAGVLTKTPAPIIAASSTWTPAAGVGGVGTFLGNGAGIMKVVSVSAVAPLVTESPRTASLYSYGYSTGTVPKDIFMTVPAVGMMTPVKGFSLTETGQATKQKTDLALPPILSNYGRTSVWENEKTRDEFLPIFTPFVGPTTITGPITDQGQKTRVDVRQRLDLKIETQFEIKVPDPTVFVPFGGGEGGGEVPPPPEIIFPKFFLEGGGFGFSKVSSHVGKQPTKYQSSVVGQLMGKTIARTPTKTFTGGEVRLPVMKKPAKKKGGFGGSWF